ncbi:hypothetical protein INT45_005230 [Circinella minor]|uniref:Uncharacterized protein n=1 Tax=Circinella minor TaxID=1195481 RepID=A0A8H7S2E6_9FUNG|nr:hypothetical protein INT45_005230 [Circinella minor]
MMKNNNNAIPLPPRSSRRSRRVYTTAASYNSQEKPKLDKQYCSRSYSEMMEIKDTSERLTVYEKTFELCMRADPQMTAWIKSVQNKGLPKVMTEGYKPRCSVSSLVSSDASSTTSTISTSSNSGNSGNTTNHRSFSIFLRKASASSRNSATNSSLPPTEPLKTSASRFIATSLSKISSSLSRQPQSSSISSRLSLPNIQSPSTTTTVRRHSCDKASNSIVPSVSSKIKRRLSSHPQRRLSTSIISPPQPQTQLNTANSNTNLKPNNSRTIQTTPIKYSITKSTTTTLRTKDKGNNHINTNKEPPAPVPSHSLCLDRLRSRRSRQSMTAGVSSISYHVNKVIVVRV